MTSKKNQNQTSVLRVVETFTEKKRVKLEKTEALQNIILESVVKPELAKNILNKIWSQTELDEDLRVLYSPDMKGSSIVDLLNYFLSE